LHKYGTQENKPFKGGSRRKMNVAQPNVEMFIQLAKILGVRVDDLLWTEDI